MNDDAVRSLPASAERGGQPAGTFTAPEGVHEDLSRAVRFGQVTQEQADRFERQLARLGARQG